ncbi:2-hydroxy-acid oxidase [Thioclava dalianensis]|uniref:Glycolate oxidase iron-sulfur subunit n=1 Tax=Thioclava dalianensis TaxID=1185766 RepID=A0A074TDM5_9RHOB|nr:glycolate oxidase subunit GlcF [Thioclava dalianensis]KEP69779.1 2-hydroxy-acid oxidase [Thioclava dalianensis]SFM85508.1 glycolate oxidase iron-sulfur subunit [Thioclava dalianensis]
MQTNFTPEQLEDPGIARSNSILRACVHCGFCTATCPSYQVLGDELDSPRGRIYLIKDMLENDRPADAKTVKHLDRCLSCLACVSTCPSGVDYMHLIDHARAHVEKTYKRPLMDRLLRATLARILPYPGRFRLAMGGAKLARPFARFLPDRRLRAMLEMAPKVIPPVSRNDDPQVFAPEGRKRYRVALQTGCAQRALNTDINDATIRLLRRLGCEVVIPKGLGCCGALAHHMGREGESHAQALANIRAYLAEPELDAVIINTSGCGTTVKDYGEMLRHGPHAQEAAKVAELACDISEFVARIGLPERQNPKAEPGALRVAYHAACSLQHGQQIKAAPKDLLRQAGFEVVEPADSHLCCGSAGTYNLLQPEIAQELRKRKVATLEAKAPQVIAAGNIGCMMQIAGGTGIPVVHSVELLDWATGGPKPRALSA